jgi:hypothetical protein
MATIPTTHIEIVLQYNKTLLPVLLDYRCLFCLSLLFLCVRLCQVESLCSLTRKHPRGIDRRRIVLVQTGALQQMLGHFLPKEADKSINPGACFIASLPALDSGVLFPSTPILVSAFPSVIGSERVILP